MEPGLYVTFFSEGERFDRELPPVGPLEHVVLRDGSMLADRKAVAQADDPRDVARFLEAELEFQRALGNEPSGARRDHLRITSLEGVYLRFVTFGDAGEKHPLPELGPYAVVVVAPWGVEADGKLIAARAGASQKVWELTAIARHTLADGMRPDIAFRTERSAYHARVRAMPAPPTESPSNGAPIKTRLPSREELLAHAKRAAAAATYEETIPLPSPVQVITPPRRAPLTPVATKPQQSATPKAAASPPSAGGSATLRTRISEIRTDTPVALVEAEQARSSRFAWAAWRLRIAIIGALVLLNVAVGLFSLRGMLQPGAAGPTNVVSVGKTVSSSSWEYTVTNVRKEATAGAARANGIYVVVQVKVVNRGADGAQLSPSAFTLTDADGAHYGALPSTSSVYAGAANPSSSFTWAQAFPQGRAVATIVVFDVARTSSGIQLTISDVPNTKIKLD